MLERYKYTDAEVKQILQSMVIIIDTREKKNEHITSYFEKHGIPYIERALNFGDYSFYIPANEELSIARDMSFENEIAIERKNSAEELSQCFTKYRARFEDEMIRGVDAKKYLLIENCDYSNIVNGEYNSDYNARGYLGSIHSFNHKYNLQIMFMKNNAYSPIYIYGVLQYYLRSIFK